MAKRRNLEVIFGADTKGFSAGMRQVSSQTKKAEASQRRAASTTSRVGSSMASAAKAAAGLAAAYISITQAKEAITVTQDLSLTTMGLERNLGLATKQASRWAVVSKARGIDSKALVMGFTTLSKRIEATKDGTEAALKPFQMLGITQKQLAATSGNYTAQVNLVAKALGNAEGSTQRQAAAQQLLGRGYQTILPMFTKGAKGLKEQLRWADEFGATLDTKTIAKMDELTTAQRRSKVATMGLQIAFAKYATPAVTKAHDIYQDFVKILNDDSLTSKERIQKLKRYFDGYADIALNALTEMAPEIAQKAGETGVQIAKGIAKGFMETGLLGKAAIGLFVMRSFGGVAALTAAGKMAGGVMGKGAGAGFLAGMSGGVGAAIAGGALIQGFQIDGLMKIYADDAEDLNGRLDQVVGKANTWQSKVSEVFGKDGFLSNMFGAGFVNAGADLFGFGGLNEDAEAAKRLKGNLEEIMTAEGSRFGRLKLAIKARAEELALTRQQKDEIWAMVRASDVGQRRAAQGRIDAGNSQIGAGTFVGPDLQAATDKQLKLISQLYGRYTPQWRDQVTQTLNAQVKAVRRTWTRNGRLTREGIERIKDIQERRKNLLAGSDPIGIGKGIVNSWKKARTATQVNMGRMVKQLKELPPKAREQAGQTMLKYAKELENKGKLPEGTVKRLRSKIMLQFGPKLWREMQADSAKGWSGIFRSFQTGTDRTAKQMANLATAARRHSRNVKAAIGGINAPVRTAYQGLAADANTAAGAFGSDEKVSVSFRKGGSVPLGRGKYVPAMVSPGERVDYRGRSWTVPGRRTKKDSVRAELPIGAAVLTDDGQARMASGESRAAALRKQLPHFATGGKVRKPKLSGGARVPTSGGQALIDKARKAALKWVEEHSASNTGDIRSYKGVPMADWVIGALEYASSKGASPQPTSGYRSHAYNVSQGRNYFSEHEETVYPGGAVDFGGYTTGYSAKMSVVNATRDYKYPLLAPIGFEDDGHASGTGHRKGGVIGAGCGCPSCVQRLRRGGRVPGYGAGGRVREITDALMRRGYDAKAAAGIVGNAYREAGPDLNPGSVGTGGGGLFGFTSGAISLANLQAAARRKGVPWTDIDFQVGFMDDHMPADLKRRLNASNSVYETTKLFMDEWERPGIPAFDDRLEGARIAMAQLNERRSAKVARTKRAVGSMAGLWRGIKKGNRRWKGTPKGAMTYARLAGKNAKLAKRAAGNYQFDEATDRMANFRRFRKKARNRMQAFHKRQARLARERAQNGNGGGNGGGGSNGGGNGGGSRGFGWTKGLPDHIRDLMDTPGLSWQQRRDLVDNALEVAQGTTKTADDKAAYDVILTMERSRKKGALSRFRKSAARFRKLGGNGRIGQIRKMLKNGDLSKQRRKQLQNELARLQGAKTRRDDALTTLNESSSAIQSAKEGKKSLQEQAVSDSEADLAAAIKDLNDTIAEQNRIQSGVAAVGQREALRMLADVLGGQMVGKGAFTQPQGVRY